MANLESKKDQKEEGITSSDLLKNKKEIKEIEVRLKRLNRGGKEQFKGEKEGLVDKLKKMGVEYVEKQKKEAVDNIVEVAGPNPDLESTGVVDSAKEKIEKVADNFEKEIGAEKNETEKENKEEVLEAKTETEIETKVEKENLKFLEKEMKDLGISEENLKGESYEKFDKLSTGSKLLVLKNLKAIILSDISSESSSQASESVGVVKGLFKNIRKSLKINKASGNLKEAELKKLSKDGFDKYKEGKYGEQLDQLSNIMSGFEIDVVEKNGKAEVSLLSIEEGMDDKEKEAIESFNESANKFLNIPKEWAYESAKFEDKKKYEKAKKEYDEAKVDLSEMGIGNGKGPEILSKINKSEWQMRMIRDFKNDSVLKEEWKEAVKNKGFFMKAISNMGNKEKLAYMASGFTIRTISATLALSVASLPFMMTVGGIRGVRGAKEDLRKKDKKDVYKEKTDSPIDAQRKSVRNEMNSMVPKEFSLNPEEWLKTVPEEEKNKYNQLKNTFNELNSKLEKENAQKLNTVEAKSLSDKIDLLINSYNEELNLGDKADSEKLKSILDSLNSRVIFTKDKMSKELINFGSRGSVVNFMELKRNMEEAENLILGAKFETDVERSERAKRLFDKILDSYKLKLDDTRKKYIRKKMIKGALTAGAFSALGSLMSEFGGLSHVLRGDISLDNFGSKVGGIGSAIKGDISMEDINAQMQENIRIKMDSLDRALVNIEGIFNTDSANVSGIPQAEIGGVANYVELNPSPENASNIAEKLNESGIKLEGLNDKAMKSIEGIGTLQKVVTLEKGDGVSKIFNGIRVHNEYSVTFVDGKTGQLTEGAAFSKMVHPGDQVILGENGKIYVVCKSGIRNNPLYGKEVVSDNLTNARPEILDSNGQPFKTAGRIEVSGLKLGQDGKADLETSFVGNTEVSSDMVDGNINNAHNAVGAVQSDALEGWAHPKPDEIIAGGPVILEKEDAKIIFPNGDDLDRIKDIAPITNGYQAVLDDGTMLNFRLGTDGYYVLESSPDLSSVSGIIERSINDVSSSLEGVDGCSWIDKMDGSSVEINDETNQAIINGDTIDFGTTNEEMANIDKVDKIYNPTDGSVSEYKIYYKNGALESFAKASEGDCYVKINKDLSSTGLNLEDNMESKTVNNVFVGDEGGVYVSPENPSNKMISEDLSKYLSESYDNFAVNYKDKMIVLGGDKIDFSGLDDLSNIKNIEPAYDGGGGVAKFIVRYQDGGLETFTAQSDGSDGIIYTKAGDVVVGLPNEIVDANEQLADSDVQDAHIINETDRQGKVIESSETFEDKGLKPRYKARRQMWKSRVI
ncbi:hypothetical protein CVU82_00980 [Candidatus Falkowbacteria bacterium HGW-Falkowbacteria-1]|uniref:Uncharacterized protein n=1 Tax=Candidatus Falkowbacteria bacterium HGW-Falkowbacteria-1 TaxID=2013768 RepID=A0A2N2EAL5_9BACT|nr:MAG: hypothetical protein CVU82_00980 [Candidatus Falkowbacteria bacterium HGW-Falkowbacteria-1]